MRSKQPTSTARRASRRGALALAISVACAISAAPSVSPARDEPTPAATFAESISSAADAFRAALAERVEVQGRVDSVRGEDEVVVALGLGLPEFDAEFVVEREGAGGFPELVAVLRVVDVRASRARAAIVWRAGKVRPGQTVVTPRRTTLLLDVPSAEEGGVRARQLREVADGLEAALANDRRFRLIRGDWSGDTAAHTRRLAEAGGYGVVIAPGTVTVSGETRLLLTERSAYTGQTLAAVQSPLPAGQGLVASGGLSRAELGQSRRRPTGLPRREGPYGAGIQALQRTPTPSGASAAAGGALQVDIREPLEAITLADVDGDGRPEMIGVTQRQLLVYRWRDRQPERMLAAPPLGRETTYVNVDAGDVNGNGRAEIVVTEATNRGFGERLALTIVSRIYEVRQGRLVEASPALPDQHAAVLRRPNGPPLLLVQRVGQWQPFEGPVGALQWQGRGYGLVKGFALPRRVESLYGIAWSDLDGDRRAELAAVGADGKLEVTDESGRSVLKERLGPIASALGVSQEPPDPDLRGRTFSGNDDDLMRFYQRPRRVLVAERRDRVELITAANDGGGFQLAVDGRAGGTNGKAFGYGWDPARGKLTRLWQTHALNAPARDVALGDLRGDGAMDLLLLAGDGDARVLQVMVLYTGQG